MTKPAIDQSTDSLFGSRQGWIATPLDAIVGLLGSTEYKGTSKARLSPGGEASPIGSAGETKARKQAMANDSIAVYRSMFGKFLATIRELGCGSVLDVNADTVSLFFMSPAMAGASKGTAARYRRLLERIFEHLVGRGLIESNPIKVWLQRLKEEDPQRKPEDKRPQAPPDLIRPERVAALREWLRKQGIRATSPAEFDDADIEPESAYPVGDHSDWRTLRDIVISLLSLTVGLRAGEITRLKRSQFTIRHSAPAGERIELNFDPDEDTTVRTAQEHRVLIDPACEDLLLAWLALRWSSGIRPSSLRAALVPPGDRVFVGVGREGVRKRKDGSSISASMLHKSLTSLANAAIEAKAISESERWLLTRGAQGLRRAYTLAEIQSGRETEVIRKNLGIHLRQSIRKYETELRAPVLVKVRT